MIHQRTDHPLAPALTSLPRPLYRIAEAVARRLIGRWVYGGVELRLPNGRVITGGDPSSSERAIIDIHSRAFFSRLLIRGELGVGESYVAGEWDSPNLVESLSLFLRNLGVLHVENALTRAGRISSRLRHSLRRNDRSGSKNNIHAHYDLGNDFYRLFLGDSWTYSCAVWRDGATSLEAAQNAKLDRLLDSLELDADQHLLEVGCGWGSLAIRAAERFGCRVTGITVSREQLDLGLERVATAGLSDRVDLKFCDYRDVSGDFDKVASVEMIEAVGYDFLDGFFEACSKSLKPGGLFALQSITMPEHKFEDYRRSIDWTQLYIFPGCLIPSIGVLSRSSDLAGFSIERLDEIGTDYSPTLAAWRERFHGNINAVHELGFDGEFVRLWNLYLAFSEAAFAERSLGDAQLLLRKRLV